MRYQTTRCVRHVAMAAAIGLLAHGAWAEKVVEWGAGEVAVGEKNGYSLELGSGAAVGTTAGTVTVTGSTSVANTGLIVNLPESVQSAEKMTVVVHYTGFDKQNANFALLGIQTDATREVLAAGQGSGNMIGESVADIGGNHSQKTRVNYTIPVSGTMIVSIDRSTKTFTMGFATEDGLQKTHSDVIPEDFYAGFIKMCLAGSQSKIGQYHRVTMTIAGVAIYTDDYETVLNETGLAKTTTVELADGETFMFTDALAEYDIIHVVCDGSIKIDPQSLTAANLAKCDLSGVTGKAKVELSSSGTYDLPVPTKNLVYRYAGETALSSFPFAATPYTANDFGTIEVACPIKLAEGAVTVLNNKNYVFAEGFSLTAPKFLTGNKTVGADPRPQQSFVQEAGTIALSASYTGNETTADMPLLFAHWPSDVTYALRGGRIECPNGNIMFGHDGGIALTVGGGEGEAVLKALGIKRDGRDNTSSLTIGEKGVVEVGAGGIDFAANKTLVLNGGTLKVTENATVSSTAGIALNAASVVEVAASVTATLNATCTGTGALVKKGTGVLALGLSRPRMDIQEGSIQLTASAEELVTGSIVLKVPENASEDVDEKFLVVASSGEEVGILSAAVDQTAHTITLTLDVNTAITESGKISELIADGTTGRVTINGANAEEPIAIMFDEIPSGIDEVLIVGTVIVRGALTDKVTFAPGASVLVDTEMEITLTKVEPTAVIRVVEGGNLKLYFSGVAQTDFTYQQTVRVEEGGVYDVAVESGRNKDYSHPIVLAGGTLTNSGEAATVNSRQYWQTSLEADSFIAVPENEFGAVNSRLEQFNFNLNGYKLTKTGPGQFTFKTARFVGGGTLEVQAGKVILSGCPAVPTAVNLVLGENGTIEIDNGATFGKPGSVTGTGTLIYTNGVAPNNGPIFQDNSWSGTVWIKNMVWNSWDLDRDGNGTATASPSKVKLTGVKGYSLNGGCNAEVILQDEGNMKALLATNGSSTATYWINKVSGSGTFGWDVADTTITAGPEGGHIFWLKDVADYTGKLVTGDYLMFSIGGTAAASRTAGAIKVADGATICPGNWLAKTITFGQTLTVKGEKGALVATVDEEPRFGKVWVALLDEEGNPRKGSYVLKTKAVDDGYEIRVEQTGLTVVIR